MRLAQSDWAEETSSFADLGLQPGDCVEMTDLLVANLDFLYEARAGDARRFGIETFSSDQKSWGFYLGRSTPLEPPPERPGAAEPPADRDGPGLLRDGLPGGRGATARLAGRHPQGQAVRPEPVPTGPDLAGTLPQRRVDGAR